MTQPIKILSAPGIKRDGTVLEGDSYIDGQWCRFQRGRPRKINGYKSVSQTVPELARGMDSFSSDGDNFLHIGQESTLQQMVVNSQGQLVSQADRTPAGFVADPDNLWQFDVFFEQVGVTNQLMAHAGVNLLDIDSSVATPIFFADVTDSGALVDTGVRGVSGGIVSLSPFLLSFGSDGVIGISGVNDPTTVTDANVTQQKIVKGLPLRGAGTGPAGIFWSLDSVIRATFTNVGGTVFAFDTLSSQSSILSSQSVIEYDGIYYWMGVDRMLMFNGVVRDIPNQDNINFFFDNVNFTHRQKVFAIKVPRFGEIWWCYPRGLATECTHAVIFNTREGYWYDTELPDAGRTAGIYAKVYQKPFMVDLDVTTNGFTLWQHETGVDKVVLSAIDPIPSFFETSEISLLTQEQAMDKSIHVARIEPDFVQSGDMTVTVKGRINARAPVTESEIFTFPDTATNGDEETVKLKEVQRLMSFRFESNIEGGDYEMGEPIAHIQPADGRIET